MNLHTEFLTVALPYVFLSAPLKEAGEEDWKIDVGPKVGLVDRARYLGG